MRDDLGWRAITVVRMSLEKMKYALIALFGIDESLPFARRGGALGFGAAGWPTPAHAGAAIMSPLPSAVVLGLMPALASAAADGAFRLTAARSAPCGRISSAWSGSR